MTLPMWLRMYSVKSESTFRYTAAFLGIISIGYLGTTLAAFAGLLKLTGLEKADTVFPTMLMEYTPVLLAAIVLAAAAAAAMSTSNSQVHAISTVVSLDLYKEYSLSEVSQEKIVLRRVMSMKIILYLAFAICILMTQWPMITFVNKIEPMILGLPFVLAWVLFWIIIGTGILLIGAITNYGKGSEGR